MARGSFVVVAALLLSAGCSADQKGAAPPPPVSPPTTAPTSSAPTIAATPFVSTADEAGAFAFSREYLGRLERAFTTGDAVSLRTLSRPACVECRKLEDDVAATYQRGDHVEGAHFEVGRFALGQSGPAFARVTVEVTSAPTVILHQDGSRTNQGGGRGSYYFLLTREGDHWLTDRLINEVRPVK
jgi:hypothetical protein